MQEALHSLHDGGSGLFKLTTPVVIVFYNRPAITNTVFERIRDNRPTTLYLVSDGARNDRNGEPDVVDALRNELERKVDWDCNLFRIYASENMGCAKRIFTALDEVFEREERAIILEDDCVPNDSFFEFCQEMLELYEEDERIASVSGNTTIKYTPQDDIDYFFSKTFGCWGWATWRRMWKKIDYNMADYENNKNNPIFRETLFLKRAYWYLMPQFEVLSKTDNKFSWAYIFYFYSILNDNYHVYPSVNLINNIGFDSDSTHTKRKPNYYEIEVEDLAFPLRYRLDIKWEKEFDKLTYERTLDKGLVIRIKQLLGLDITRPVLGRLRG